MRTRRTQALAALLALGCGSTGEPTAPPPLPTAAIPSAARSTSTPPAAPASALPAASDPRGAPLSGPPRLVVENHTTVALRLREGLLVDVAGELGTRALWPDPGDCPDAEPKERVLPLGGVYELAPPTRVVDGASCTSTQELPPGRYVVVLPSGYGSELYASAEVTLPLREPVRLRMEARPEVPACTEERARRAARLVLATAQEEGAAEALLRGCDATTARCGALPLPDDELAPEACTITLHENLLRIRRAPGGDLPKEITAWLDPPIVASERPEVSGSSSAEVRVAGRRVVFEGVTGHHRHEHGGRAARIGAMAVLVHNTTGRAVPVRLLGVTWLEDSSCGSPGPSPRQPGRVELSAPTVPPGTSTLTIGFEPRDAYQAHCDVFASRARLLVEDQELVITSEHEVTRFEPLRH